MNWIKKQFDKIIAGIMVLAVGTGVMVFNNGQRVAMTTYQGRHIVDTSVDIIRANNGEQIPLDSGERIIMVTLQMHRDGDKWNVRKAWADTVDVSEATGFNVKITRCER